MTSQKDVLTPKVLWEHLIRTNRQGSGQEPLEAWGEKKRAAEKRGKTEEPVEAGEGFGGQTERRAPELGADQNWFSFSPERKEGEHSRHQKRQVPLRENRPKTLVLGQTAPLPKKEGLPTGARKGNYFGKGGGSRRAARPRGIAGAVTAEKRQW